MREMSERPVCHRAEDLVTYLYGEAGEPETLDFREHLQHCDSCRSEFALFNQVHESILVWRNEALGSALISPASLPEPAIDAAQFVRHETKLSALAALREFFSVSPLWLRGATAFAGLLLCVLVVLTLARSWEPPKPVVKSSDEPRFTQADVDKAVAEARSQAVKEQQSSPLTVKEEVVESPAPKRMVATIPRTSKPRIKGLTQEERQQLAADLRLVPANDEEEIPFVISDQPNPDKPNPNQPNQ